MDSRPHPYGRIAHELAGSPFSAITYVAETASTNADAASLLGSEEHLGRSIVAEHQRRGQGRNGRSWTSLPGTALLVTTILPRSVDSANVWAVPFWVALAVRGALSKRGIRTTLHWWVKVSALSSPAPHRVQNKFMLRALRPSNGPKIWAKRQRQPSSIACSHIRSVLRPSSA